MTVYCLKATESLDKKYDFICLKILYSTLKLPYNEFPFTGIVCLYIVFENHDHHCGPCRNSI